MTANVLRWPALLLGIALGGFFDGILLHQILQWHHLLSAVDAVRDMRTQLIADGAFHALMYLIAAFALYRLWSRRSAVAAPGASAVLWGNALIGFGAWHVADAVLSHWITGIHRIRMDAANPLLWDLAWFLVFGVLPALLGMWLPRRAGPGGGGDGHGRAAAATLSIAVAAGGPLAALPASGGGPVMVMFAPGVSAGAALNALASVDARVLWVDRSGGLWAVSLPEDSATWPLFRGGALLVGGSAAAFGCLAWSRPSGPARPASSAVRL